MRAIRMQSILCPFLVGLCLCTTDAATKSKRHAPIEAASGAHEDNVSLMRSETARNKLRDEVTNEDNNEDKLDIEALEKRVEDSVTEKVEKRLVKLEEAVGQSVHKEDGSRVPTFRALDGSVRDLTLFERLRYMEHKVDGATNWLKEPMLFNKQQYECRNGTDLHTDHHVCFDGWEQALLKHHSGDPHKCIVYDLGIRANPEFGVNLMKEYGCAVRAYDPSPTAVKWWNGDTDIPNAADIEVSDLKQQGDMYKFYPVGAGGQDGKLQLYDYNWEQVSIVKAENDRSKRLVQHGPVWITQEPPDDVGFHMYELPVQTLGTMMRENGDSYIDVLKIDIEGSEYMFLQDVFDRMGCPPVGQITIEWHNFGLDERYGSSPEVNTLHNLLNSCGFKAFYNRDHWIVDPEVTEGSRKLPPMRITLSSYCKDCLAATGEKHPIPFERAGAEIALAFAQPAKKSWINKILSLFDYR